MESEKVHFFNLDILRFICAFAVAFAHLYESYYTWLGENDFFSGVPKFKKMLDTFVGNLSLGVTMFFVISGFLITYLLLCEKKSLGNLHIGKFVIRRSLRIWPLYYLSIFLGYIFVSILDYPSPDYIQNIFFWNNFHAIEILRWQYPFAHFWSISIEEHFYIIWPFLLYLVPVERSWLLVCGGILFSITYRYYIAMNTDLEHLYLSLYMHTLVRMDEILVGALVAFIHFKKPIVIRIPLLVRIIIYLIFVAVLFAQPQGEYWVWGIYSVLFKKYVYLFFIVFWMLNYLFNPNAMMNFKKKNILHYLGKISFGIYIYHNMLIPIYINYIVHPFKVYQFSSYFALYFSLFFIISTISYELFEKYFLRIKGRFAFIQTQR